MPRLSGELRPGRSPISMTESVAPNNSPTSSASATRACVAMTTGEKRVSAGRCERNAASTGAAWRATASEERPSPMTRHTSHSRFAAARSRSASVGSSCRPKSGRRRYVVRSSARLRACSVSQFCWRSVASSASTSSAAWMASRAMAWAQPKRSVSSVGMPAPARPSAKRAGVAERHCAQGLGVTGSSLMAPARPARSCPPAGGWPTAVRAAPRHR